MSTEIQGAVQRSIVQHENQLLAQQQRRNEAVETSLIATDQQRSVLNLLTAAGLHPLSYTPYGHRPSENGLLGLLGFNGERPDPVTGCYLLGNGYRAFNPVLMRFNRPDRLSPFGDGGLNAYVYCSGEPINRNDSTGKSWALIKTNLKNIVRLNRSKQFDDASAALHTSKSEHMNNIRRIGKGAFSFEDIYKGKRRLNFSAQGEETPIHQQSRIGVNGQLWSAEQLYSDAVARGVNFAKFDNIRIIACFSGNGGNSSFAATFAKLSKTQTKGYIGEITSAPQPESMEKLFKAVKSQFPTEPYEFVNTIHPQAHFIRKSPINDVTPHNFRPIIFPS